MQTPSSVCFWFPLQWKYGKYLWEITSWRNFFKDGRYKISGKHLLDSGSLMQNSFLSRTILLQIEKIQYQVTSQWLLLTFSFKYELKILVDSTTWWSDTLKVQMKRFNRQVIETALPVRRQSSLKTLLFTHHKNWNKFQIFVSHFRWELSGICCSSPHRAKENLTPFFAVSIFKFPLKKGKFPHILICLFSSVPC